MTPSNEYQKFTREAKAQPAHMEQLVRAYRRLYPV